MNVNELYKGQVFKNYKALCGELEMEIKKSVDTKNAQFKELARFCSFHKDGHKIIIDEIYNIPLEKVDGRGKNEGSRRDIYGNLVQLLITDILAQCNGHVSISRSWLLRQIGVTNFNYSTCGENVRKLSEYIDMGTQVIYDFYNINNSNFKNIIETALDNLMDKRIIMYAKIIKVCVDENYARPRTANKDEIAIIMKTEKEILNQFGYKKMSHVRISKDWKRFRIEVQKVLRDKCKIKYYYMAYDISINDDYIEEERNELLDLLLESAKRKEYKSELNQKILDHIVQRAKIRHEKAKSFTYNKKQKYRSKESYVDEITKLAKILIDINSFDITYNVLNIKLEYWGEAQAYLIDEELNELF